jgi:isoaspartyl peptidase/L-asparaginase-like protein (Ntn-hydrolase superfamily)
MVPGTSGIVVFVRKVLEPTRGELDNDATGDDAVAGEIKEDETGASTGRCTTGGIRIGSRGMIRETPVPGTGVESDDQVLCEGGCAPRHEAAVRADQ